MSITLSQTFDTPAAKHTVLVRRLGYALSTLFVLFLVMDAGMKLAALPVVIDAQAQLGWPATAATARGLGLLLTVLTILYIVPRTSILGAILLTGYLGGAVATHVRLGNPWATHILSPIYVAALLWGGLWLRDRRLRAVFDR
jgi:hypothetical protein